MSDDPFGDVLSGTKSIQTPQQAPAPVASSPPPAADDPFGALIKDHTAPAAPASVQDNGPAPDWADIPRQAASNLIPSGQQFLGNIAHTALHPIETAENLGSAGLGYMEKAGRHLGLPSGQGYEQYADAVNQMISDKYGSMDNFKKSLAHDPVGVLADASAIFTGGGSLAGRLPGVAGKIGEAVNAVGRTVDPMNVISKPAGVALKGAGKVAKEGFGLTTGAGPEAIAEAAGSGFKGGEEAKAFRENMRGNVPVENVVNDALNAVHNIIDNKNANYKLGISQADLDKPITPANFQKIRTAVYDASDIGRHKGWQYDTGAAKANNDLRGIFGDFLNQPHIHTLEGLDALKQAVGKYKEDNKLSGTKAGLVADTYYNAIKGAIVDQAPAYAKVMDTYSEAKNLLGQIQKSFSLPANERKLNIDTALRKLQSVMRNNVNTNYGYRTTLLQHLEENGAPNIRTAVAGQALSSAAPRGLARIATTLAAEVAAGIGPLLLGNPHLILPALGAATAAAVTSSPRLVGEGAYYAGKVAKPVSKVLNRPVARAAQAAGRWMPNVEIHPVQQNRGGAVDRAKRMSKHHG